MIKVNYRQTCILTASIKVFETIIAQQLIDVFKYICNDMLYAYRNTYGCEHALLKLVDSWKNALDDNQFAGKFVLDLSFDCVPWAQYRRFIGFCDSIISKMLIIKSEYK